LRRHDYVVDKVSLKWGVLKHIERESWAVLDLKEVVSWARRVWKGPCGLLRKARDIQLQTSHFKAIALLALVFSQKNKDFDASASERTVVLRSRALDTLRQSPEEPSPQSSP
jgi:hypothetical protein